MIWAAKPDPSRTRLSAAQKNGRTRRSARSSSAMRPQTSSFDEFALRVGRCRVAQHITATPDRLDVVVAAGRLAQFLAQLADEHVDDLEFGLVHAAVEMIEEHLLGEGGTLAQAQKLENAIFFAREAKRHALHLDGAAIEINQQLAGTDHRFRMTLGAPDDRLDAGDQLATVEGLGEEVVGAEAQALDLVIELAETRQDEYRRTHARGAKAAD